MTLDLALAGLRVLLGITVLVISAYAYCAYAKAIRRGKVKPIRITWIMLFVITAISLESQRDMGFGLVLALAIARIFGAGVLLLLSIKYGKNGFHWSHPLVVIAVLGCLAVRIWVDNKTHVVCCTTVADFIATLPTIIGAWQEPENETPGPWLQDSLAALLDALSVTKLALGLVVYPLYLCAVCAGIAVIVVARTPARTQSIRRNVRHVYMSIIFTGAAVMLAIKLHRRTLHLSHIVSHLSIPAIPGSQFHVQKAAAANLR